MRHHTIPVLFLSIAWFMPNAVTGQEPAHGRVSTSAPPHPVGSHPDLQGYWTRHVHPLECPHQEFFTEQGTAVLRQRSTNVDHPHTGVTKATTTSDTFSKSTAISIDKTPPIRHGSIA